MADRSVLYLTKQDSIPRISTDVIVIGSGIAGMTAALELSKSFDVVLLTKSDISMTATWLAQGGLAATVSKSDSPLYHIKDTVVAGDGLCNIEAVEILVNDGPKYVNDLIKLGTRFDVEKDKFRLGREGGHSKRRILHFKDLTGSEIQSSLVKAGTAFESFKTMTYHFASDLIVGDGRVCGAIAINLQTGKPKAILARKVIIASGGAGQVYTSTTNPDVATGDGIAMAYRAGATVSDLEMMQFHPTVFFKDKKAAFLITEALRGEGALLIDKKGKRIMEGIHPLKELAPRDIVSRQIFLTMRRTRTDSVFLDARHIGASRLKSRFPAVWEFLIKGGIDASKDLVPVAPAAHYLIGGIRTDAFGRTDIDGLYACGEAAATGVHGANRLASNSLLEGLVFSRRIAEDIKLSGAADKETKKARTLRQLNAMNRLILKMNVEASDLSVGSSVSGKQLTTPMEAQINLKDIMTTYVSFERDEKGLKVALKKIKRLVKEIDRSLMNKETFETENMLNVCELIIRSAIKRKESRGVHFRTDHPHKDDDNWLKNINLKLGKISVSPINSRI